MTKRRYASALGLVVVGALLGGVVADWLRGGPAMAADEPVRRDFTRPVPRGVKPATTVSGPTALPELIRPFEMAAVVQGRENYASGYVTGIRYDSRDEDPFVLVTLLEPTNRVHAYLFTADDHIIDLLLAASAEDRRVRIWGHEPHEAYTNEVGSRVESIPYMISVVPPAP